MRISFNQTTGPDVHDRNGYGYAGNMCKKTLEELGHEVGWRDDSADVEMNFIQPDMWYWSGVDYRIGYLPWESTEFHPGWVEKMNEVDEVWTPSPVIAQWMMDAGVTKEPKIYQHGVESVWEANLRPHDDMFNVMHHGAEAIRKNSQDVINVFNANLRTAEDAVLTLKVNFPPGQRYVDSDWCRIRNGRIPLEELLGIYQECNLFCYPSWGEGFGLAPLQAMATGMPTMVTRGWAPYQHLVPEHSLIDSELVDSPWPWIHPGKMFRPDINDLQDKLLWHYNNREQATTEAYATAAKVHEEYNWKDLTQKAFSHLV